MKHFKHFLLSLALLLSFNLGLYAQDIEPIVMEQIVSQIRKVQAPAIMEHCLVFTAEGKYRYAGIAFDHENYNTIHPFERIVRRDYDGTPMKDINGKNLDTILFFVAKIPDNTKRVKYRLVLDGLWTRDPLNALAEFDERTGLTVSVKEVPLDLAQKTGNKKNGAVQFIYEGDPGETITLCGTFNNWDPFMYSLTETKPGFYEINLPLPKGTYYYTFMNGTERVADKTNTERAYGKDGRIASVLQVL